MMKKSIEKLEELVKLVGKPYKALDENGYYFGCFEPVYFLHPKLSRFKLPKDKGNYFDFALLKIKFFTSEVNVQDVQNGDLIVFEYPSKILHLGVYLGNFKMIQTFKNSTMTINKVDFENKRIIGVYRFKQEIQQWD